MFFGASRELDGASLWRACGRHMLKTSDCAVGWGEVFVVALILMARGCLGFGGSGDSTGCIIINDARVTWLMWSSRRGCLLGAQ